MAGGKTGRSAPRRLLAADGVRGRQHRTLDVGQPRVVVPLRGGRGSCTEVFGCPVEDRRSGRRTWTLDQGASKGVRLGKGGGAGPGPPQDPCIIKSTFEEWCDKTGGLRECDVVLVSWLPCEGQAGANLGPLVLDSICSENQRLAYVGSGPNGPAGTSAFYDRLGAEFEEDATEPLPRVYPGVFPRDFLTVYHRKTL